jgi:hypothetical protein
VWVSSLLAQLEDRSGVGALDLVGAVVAVSKVPYGRPGDRSAAGVVREWRGTCSTKHMLLAEIMRESWPEARPVLWHRVYRVTRELANDRWGPGASRLVPRDGLVDVHTFAVVTVANNERVVDATFPVTGWDGVHDMTLACGDGDDHPAGGDVLGSKAQLVERWCDPAVREPFIASLTRRTRS